MKAVMLVLAIIWTLVAILWGSVGKWMVTRDIDYVMDRAGVAADAGDMLTYMKKVSANMEVRGMTRGHTAFVFKTDLNDVGKQYEAVKKIIGRLELIEKLDKGSTAYQVALDDIRGTIRELPRMAGGWYYVHTLWILVLITVVVWVIIGLIALFSIPY